ncbi:hypothetical protein NDU88_006800 [Pleurodeles waltl]|uniref:Uncharacterized protein n=1 Tax=Pleurodeles waltl TaxID=8319 RepID=A0AAV7N1X5_PLEWA|nr:hypothetical protein NDU88_006800 [Pleurodeles waltl]
MGTHAAGQNIKTGATRNSWEEASGPGVLASGARNPEARYRPTRNRKRTKPFAILGLVVIEKNKLKIKVGLGTTTI